MRRQTHLIRAPLGLLRAQRFKLYAMQTGTFTTSVSSQSELLKIFTRTCLLRQCRYPPSDGLLRIEGVYAPNVIRDAFDNIGDWSERREGTDWIGRVEIDSLNSLASLLDFQSLKSCSLSQRAHGCMAVSTRGEGWAWMASPSRPLVLHYKATADTCRLRVTGCIIRFSDGTARYPEGPRPPSEEDRSIVTN